MALHFIAFALSICSLVLLLLANIGTTFSSSVLNKLYLVEISESVTGRSIRYGVYNSCLYYKNATDTAQSCTSKAPAYSFDTSQFAIVCGADSSNSSMVSTYSSVVSSTTFATLFKLIVLIMPAVILAFVSFCCTLLLRKGRRNNVIPLIGTFTSLLSFLVGAAGLALVIVTFWKGLDILETRIEGLSHQWGPSIYMVGIGIGCILGTFICFMISLFTRTTSKRDTFNLMDYSSTTTKGNDNTKRESDNNYGQAISDTTTPQHYPSYHYQPDAYQQPAAYNNYSHQVYNTYDAYAQSPHAYDAYAQSPHAHDAYQQQTYQGGYQHDPKQPHHHYS